MAALWRRAYMSAVQERSLWKRIDLMKLYLLTVIGKVNWDEYEGAVIAAPDPTSARGLMAVHAAADSKQDYWSSLKSVKCRVLSGDVQSSVKEGVVLSSFRSG